MRDNPLYVGAANTVYKQFQRYRKLRDVCATIRYLDNQIKFPETEPFTTLFTTLIEAMNDPDGKDRSVEIALEIKEQWLRKVKYKL